MRAIRLRFTQPLAVPNSTPDLKSSVSLRSIDDSGQHMPLRSNVGGYDSLHFQKSLRMLG